jgi:hypothetical protein
MKKEKLLARIAELEATIAKIRLKKTAESDLSYYTSVSPMTLMLARSALNACLSLDEQNPSFVSGLIVEIKDCRGESVVRPFFCAGGLTKDTKNALNRQMAYTMTRDQDIMQSFQKILDKETA